MYFLESLEKWLEYRLEKMGFDASIYTNYILSLLQSDACDIEEDNSHHDHHQEIPVNDQVSIIVTDWFVLSTYELFFSYSHWFRQE